MKAKTALVAFFLFLLYFSVVEKVFGALVINEVSPAASPEWIEIYNKENETVSLKGYEINFGSESQTKTFCDNDQIPANSYKVIILSSSWLNNEGDTVVLKSGSNTIDSISYGQGSTLQKPNNAQSITRSPENSEIWILTDTPTQQGDLVNFECPTPTPTPTAMLPSPTTTRTPTQIPTSRSTQQTSTIQPKVPTPTPNVKITPTIIPTSISKNVTQKYALTSNHIRSTSNKDDNAVLGVKEMRETYKNNSGKNNLNEQKKSSVSQYMIIIGVLFLCSACGILAYRKYKKDKEMDI